MHMTPEPSGQEIETSELVAETLVENGYAPRVMAGGTGVVADLDLGAPGGSFIAMRSELDCVFVNDDKQVAYASTVPGLCHACGHDAHTTITLAAAAVVAKAREQLADTGFRHNLRFIFQPAEEEATGARSMIKQGALRGVEAVVALHVDPFLDAGLLGLRHGPITSACKSFEVRVRGRSGHSARPYEAVDPIPAVTAVVDLMYQLCPRSMDGRYPLALNVSSIESGSSYNAIPDVAVIRGTVRAARLEDLDSVQRRMTSVVAGAAEATGCEIELDFVHACPATDNDPTLVDMLEEAVIDTIGPEAPVWLDVPSLGGEDFAFYQEVIPGAIVRLGAGGDPKLRRPLHSSLFDIDERCLEIGTTALVGWALRLASTFDAHGG
jgi:amidohydrolase